MTHFAATLEILFLLCRSGVKTENSFFDFKAAGFGGDKENTNHLLSFSWIFKPSVEVCFYCFSVFFLLEKHFITLQVTTLYGTLSLLV
jgi:hypothetical protein